MATLSRTTTRLFSPSRAIPRTICSATGPTASLHQQGPSRSAVVHEQALPQSQNQTPSPPFLQTQHASPPSTQPFPPQDEATTINTLISHIPIVQSLRNSKSNYKESRPHLSIPPPIRQHHLVGGSLAGPGKLALAPFMWTNSTSPPQPSTHESESEPPSKTNASSVISVFHIGRDLCGHPGFVHGGLLSVLFDEVFARCVSAAFPSGLGMTANLSVDFRKPALPDRLYVLRAQTVKVEGRKAWVEGRMVCLPFAAGLADAGRAVPEKELLEETGEGAVMVAEAKALFVEPKFASVSGCLMSSYGVFSYIRFMLILF